MLLLIECHKLPDCKMYWEMPTESFVQTMSVSMSFNTFERILQNLHFCDNIQFDKLEKFSKLRPIISYSNKRSLKFFFNEGSKSIDESMTSYWRTHGSRQQINNKSIRTGYNIWVLSEAHGCLVQFELYQDVKKRKQVASSATWGLWQKFVLRLIEWLPSTVNHHIFMKNYFTSFRLLISLDLTTFQQQVCSTKIGSTNALALGTADT